MNFQKYLERLERLHLLIRRKATGSPNELANKLGLSKRQTLEYVRELKDLDIPIAYCKHTKTYYYEKDVIFKFEFRTLSKEELSKIEARNREINYNFFYTNFQTAIKPQCKNIPLEC